MGGRGSGGGRGGGGGGGAARLHDDNTENLISRLENNLDYINKKLKDNPTPKKEQRLKDDAAEIKYQIEYYKKADKIKFINEQGGSDIDITDSYSSKEIDKMYRQVRNGKKMKKVGYEWVVDHNS